MADTSLNFIEAGVVHLFRICRDNDVDCLPNRP